MRRLFSWRTPVQAHDGQLVISSSSTLPPLRPIIHQLSVNFKKHQSRQ
jgi:hypothetical protein